MPGAWPSLQAAVGAGHLLVGRIGLRSRRDHDIAAEAGYWRSRAQFLPWFVAVF